MREAGPNLAAEDEPLAVVIADQQRPKAGAHAFRIGEPSDNNMAVGPNHIVETVNTEWAVYDKTGHILAGFPKSLGSIWTGLGGACTGNQGDPIVQYDRLADRWFLSQIGSEIVPYSLCQAVSKTNDPTGAYSLYEYSFNDFPDYPHYSVWPTASNAAYLQMAHLFLSSRGGFVGTAACAYDRTAMLAGKSNPVQICFTIANDGGFQPLGGDRCRTLAD